MFTFERKPRSSTAHSPAPKPASQRSAQAPSVNPLWLQLAMSRDAGAVASPEMTEEGRRDVAPSLPAPRGAPWSRIGRAASEAGVKAGPSPPVAPGPQFNFARIPLLPPTVQRKATISSPGDPYEREADEVADKVMRMAEPMSLGNEEKKVIQTKRAPSANNEATLTAGAAERVAERTGAPLPQTARDFFEPRFGQDFSQVRIHADSEAMHAAQAVHARAYTVGQNIVFNRGEYAPGDAEGRRLLAHELTHVAQRSQSGGLAQRGLVQRQPKDTAEKSEEPSPHSQWMVKTLQKGNLLLRVVADHPKELPDGSPNTVGNLGSGTIVEVIAKKNDLGWYEVTGEVGLDGGRREKRTGFVHRKYLFPASDAKDAKDAREQKTPDDSSGAEAPAPQANVRQAELAKKLLLIDLQTESIAPLFANNEDLHAQYDKLTQHIAYVDTLLHRAAIDDSLMRAAEVGVDLAGITHDLMRGNREAWSRSLSNRKEIEAEVNHALIHYAWTGMNKLEADPTWAQASYAEATELIASATSHRDNVLEATSVASVMKAGVLAATIMSGAASITKLFVTGYGALTRIGAWMKGLSIEAASLEFAGAGAMGSFRVVSTAGALELGLDEVVVLAEAGKISATALDLYMMSQGGGGGGKPPVPKIPAGVKNTSEFGTNVMKWGSGDAEAKARMATITQKEMEQAGVTREIAEEWREFYRFIKTNFPSNPSAGGRFDLMQKVVELLGGK